ncbi:probable anion transporter 3, chloroplastic isoform X2 [Mangifera indica]|uniref:probable anion transporter 3, chloroplastic isoform X2 n=1 Tax=Mangifera indica TaxID=29780 RepID=UPI001CFC2BDD|nr:probable anion transporter 3, chloroplastic isoform X2 [Mangifera indica]
MAAKSLLHSSFSPKPSCFFNSESKSTKFRTSQLGFKPRNLKAEDDVKWGENISFSMISRVIKTKKKQQKGGMVVKCTAEGIERSLLKIGGRGETKVLIAERYKVVALLACVMCLCNADRVVMSVAIVPLAAKYGWSSAFLGIVQSSFLWGYIFSSVVGGVLVDKYGGRRVLACGVVLWSLSTLLTPWAANHSTLALLAARAFFGLAEGVALPAMTTLSSRWFPSHERASAVGISMAGFHLGNVVGLVLTPVMLATTGITGPFFLFSSIGLLWMTTWSSVATDDPRESPFISKSELRLIQAGKADSIEKKGNFPSLRLLLSKMPTWAIIVANITNNWGYFVLLTWMPIYFKTVFNVNLKQAAWFSAVPWGTMAVCGYIAGKASDSLIKAGHPITSVRKIMQYVLTVNRFHRPWTVVALLELCQVAGSGSCTYHSCTELQLFQPGRISSKYARNSTRFCRISPWHFKFSRNISCNSQHNWNWLLCPVAWILSSIPRCHCRSILRSNCFLEPVCER